MLVYFKMGDSTIEEATVFKDELSWKRFIPPLPTHTGNNSQVVRENIEELN